MPIAGNISRIVRDSYEEIHAFSICSNISVEAWNASFTQSLSNNKGKITWSRFFESLADEMVKIDMKVLEAEREAGSLPNKELLLQEIINKYDEYDETLTISMTSTLHGGY